MVVQLGPSISCVKLALPVAVKEQSLEMENEEKIRHDARRRLEEQLKQYRVQRHKETVSECVCVNRVSH